MGRFLAGLAMILSFCIIGMTAGLWAGGQVASAGSGAAGGAVVALGGVLGGLLGLVIGMVGAFRMSHRGRLAMLFLTGLPALGLIGAFGWASVQSIHAESAPASAYAGLRDFQITLARDHDSDPVLARQVRIDTTARHWQLRMPDGRTCQGTLRASVQARLETALAAAIADAPYAENCAVDSDMPGTYLGWHFNPADESAAAVALMPGCLAAHPALAVLGNMVGQAPTMAPSRVRCF